MAVVEVALPRTEAIALLNDNLRRTGTGGTIMITRGVAVLPGFDRHQLAEALAAYEAFDADNDPHGERDFGTVTLWGAKLLWKIDYYDAELKFGSEDASNPEVTKRVLTVMAAAEW